MNLSIPILYDSSSVGLSNPTSGFYSNQLKIYIHLRTVLLEKTLESPLDCKEVQPIHPKGDGYSLEGLMLKLKLQYFGHLLRRADLFEKTLKLGKTEGGRRSGRHRGWDGWIASPTQWTWVWVGSGNWWWTGRPGVLQFMQRVGCKESDTTEQLNWTLPKTPSQKHPEYLMSNLGSVVQPRWHIKLTSQCLCSEKNKDVLRELMHGIHP